MSHPINLMVVDLSHYDPANDYAKVKAAGIVGVIYKATQGVSYTDPTYKAQKKLALAAGLKWGAFHFGDSSNVEKQVANFLNFADPDPDILISLDFEDNSSNTMSLEQARQWIDQVETQLVRPEETVFYSGNLIKERLGSTIDPFWSARRLWLAQYGSDPSVPASWQASGFWLWQYTDGTDGPTPHTVPGCDSGGVDCNSYDGTADQLVSEWASGVPSPTPPAPPPNALVSVTIVAPPGVQVLISASGDVTTVNVDD